MFPPLNRPPSTLAMKKYLASSLAFAAACALVAGLQLGCDNAADRADKAVQEQIDEGRGGTVPRDAAGLPAVPTALTSAVANTDASPATKAETLAWLGQSEVQRAAALLARADREDVAARGLIAEINRLNARLQSNNAVVAGLARLEPTRERAALREQRGAVQGENDPVWIKHETGPVPALKGVDERLARLQEQIGQLEQQSGQVSAQRSKFLAEAERLERESEGAGGKQSVQLFNQSSEQRKKAADLGVQADAIEGRLLPLRQDLQLAQSEKQLLQRAVQSFDGRLAGTEKNWQAVQRQIEALSGLSKALIGPAPNEAAAPPPGFTAPGAGQTEAGRPEGDAESAPVPSSPPTPGAAPSPTTPGARPAPRPGAGGQGIAAPASLAGKLRWLTHLSKSIEAQRGEAEALLTSALAHCQSAGQAAAALSNDLSQQMNSEGASQRPEYEHWQRLSALYNPSEFKLKQAAVQLMLGGLRRDRAALLALRSNTAKALGPVLQAAKVNAPAELAEHNVDAELTAAREAAKQAYADADALLTEVVEAPRSNDVTGAARSAHALRLAGLYGRAQLAAAYNPQEAAQFIARAKQLATQADGTELPAATALPAVIQDVLGLRSPAAGPAGTRRPGAAAPPSPTPAPTTPATPPITDTPAATDAPPPTEGPAPADMPAPTEQSAPPAGQEGSPPAPDAGTAAASPDAGAQPASSDQPAAEQAPADAPVEPAPVEPAPADETPVEPAPTDQTPADQTPADQAPAEQPAGGQK